MRMRPLTICIRLGRFQIVPITARRRLLPRPETASRLAIGGLISFFLLAPLPQRLEAASQQKSSIVVISTGGTIAGRTGAAQIDGKTLVAAVPDLAKHAQIEVEEFSRIGSSQITPDHWLRMAKRVNRLFEENEDLTGIVITHGTDTLEETAFFLNLTVKDPRPVVLVGSMRVSDEISADGPANLLNAVRVAVAPSAVGKGVLVVLNEDIATARDVWKTDNRRVHTFRSPEFGFLGVVDPDEVVFYRATLHPHTTQSQFDVSSLEALPRVVPVEDYTGSDGALLDSVVKTEPDGIVVATFAGGRMSPHTRRALSNVLKGALPVVIASRVPGGRIVSGSSNGTIVARDLSPRRARILLMLALTVTRQRSTIQEIFDRY